jgi:hypothetical protein
MRFLFALFFVAAGLFCAGCASTVDSENASVRPWNQPRGWEHGLPTTINEGR